MPRKGNFKNTLKSNSTVSIDKQSSIGDVRQKTIQKRKQSVSNSRLSVKSQHKRNLRSNKNVLSQEENSQNQDNLEKEPIKVNSYLNYCKVKKQSQKNQINDKSKTNPMNSQPNNIFTDPIPIKHQGRGRPKLISKKQQSKNQNSKLLQSQTQQTVFHNSAQFINWNQEKLTTNYKPQRLVGRLKQKQQIGQFILNCLSNEINNRILYISGCPGVGKTATTMQVIQKQKSQLNSDKISFQYINALQLKNSEFVYEAILDKIKIKEAVKQKQNKRKKNTKQQCIALDEYLKKCKKRYFFVIDQIDYLYTKDQEVMYNLVEWSSQSKRALSIIMIANTIDYPQRLSAKIGSRMGTNRICFKPYSSIQIKNIIQERLTGSSFFEEKTIKFATKKFACYTSDLRKIFNIFKTAISNRSKQKVTQLQLTRLWNQVSQEQHEQWRLDLPERYLEIIQTIKKSGGKAHSYDIFQLLQQKKASIIDIDIILQQLCEMGIIKIHEKVKNGYKGISAELLRI